MNSLLICPVCGLPLIREPKRYCCEKGHSFDIAKQGYVNLLLTQQSSKKRHGDDGVMVQARRAFLDKGYYACLKDALCDAALRFTQGEVALLDAGCGEGYYTAALTRYLREEGRACRSVGIDISKSAVACAAKRQPAFECAVAGVFAMPVASGSITAVLNVFAPLAPEEYCRVLQPKGVLLRAVPRKRHLMGLKEAVYDKAYENTEEDPALAGFRLLEEITVEKTLILNNQTDIEALFMMTPYYYKTGRDDQKKLQKLTALQTELSFSVLVYEKSRLI